LKTEETKSLSEIRKWYYCVAARLAVPNLPPNPIYEILFFGDLTM